MAERTYTLRWIKLEDIKAQLRIDPDDTIEDKLLTMYGSSEEETMLNILGRTYEDMIATYGEIPAPIVQSTLELVDISYQHRSPIDQQSMYLVPYTFDLRVKPYIKLTKDEEA